MISLTVGDVYAFLEDSGLFPRFSSKAEVPLPVSKERKEKEKESTPSPIDEPCFVCGIKKRLHPALAPTAGVKKEPALDETVAWVCDIVPPQEFEQGLRIPVFDVTKFFGDGLQTALYAEATPNDQVLPQPTAASQALTPWRHTPRQTILLSSPDLTLAIHKSVGALHLPHFPELPSLSLQNRIPHLEVEKALAPSALLAAVLKPFISVVVRSALDIARRDMAIASGGGNDGAVAGKLTRTKRGRKMGCILTPGHVIRGLSLPAASGMSSAPGSCGVVAITPKDALGLCLTRIGVPLEFGRTLMRALCRTEGRDGNVEMMETGNVVKPKVESP